MVFSNLIFLYLFLPLCLAAYFLCRSVPAKNAVLIVFSLIFYAWGEPVYLLLMIASAAVNWGFGLLIEKRHKRVFFLCWRWCWTSGASRSSNIRASWWKT